MNSIVALASHRPVQNEPEGQHARRKEAISYLPGNSVESDSEVFSLECGASRSVKAQVRSRSRHRRNDDEALCEARGVLKAAGLGACFWVVVMLIWLLA